MKWVGIVEWLLGFLQKYVTAYQEKAEEIQKQLDQVRADNQRLVRELEEETVRLEQQKERIRESQRALNLQIEEMTASLNALREQHATILKDRSKAIADIRNAGVDTLLDFDFGTSSDGRAKPGQEFGAGEAEQSSHSITAAAEDRDRPGEA